MLLPADAPALEWQRPLSPARTRGQGAQSPRVLQSSVCTSALSLSAASYSGDGGLSSLSFLPLPEPLPPPRRGSVPTSVSAFISLAVSKTPSRAELAGACVASDSAPSAACVAFWEFLVRVLVAGVTKERSPSSPAASLGLATPDPAEMRARLGPTPRSDRSQNHRQKVRSGLLCAFDAAGGASDIGGDTGGERAGESPPKVTRTGRCEGVKEHAAHEQSGPPICEGGLDHDQQQYNSPVGEEWRTRGAERERDPETDVSEPAVMITDPPTPADLDRIRCALDEGNF